VNQGRTYHCSPAIVWVKDADQTLVVDGESGQSWTLRGAEAVVWDLLAVGCRYRKIVELLALTLSLSPKQADQSLSSMLRKWRAAGIVQVSGANRHGEPGNQHRL